VCIYIKKANVCFWDVSVDVAFQDGGLATVDRLDVG